MARSAFRTAGGMLEVRLPELKGVRDVRGRFTSAQGAMRERNATFAQGLQAQVVRNIEARITRPGASTNRLVTVTADSRNAQYDTWSISVGIRAFLDHSVAKYWRTFELGSGAVWKHPFTGTQLMPKGRPPFPVAHGQTPGLRTTRAQLPWMDGRRFVVSHEIAPRYAYRDAVSESQPRTWGRANARQFLVDVLGRQIGFGFTGQG